VFDPFRHVVMQLLDPIVAEGEGQSMPAWFFSLFVIFFMQLWGGLFII
jgi:hypothetical protein